MTRFARASGSKGDNQKKPEEATPWSEIKASLVKKPSESLPQAVRAEDLLAQSIPSTSEIQSVWAELVEEEPKGRNKKLKNERKKRSKESEQETLETISPKKKKKEKKNATEKPVKIQKIDNPKKTKKAKMQQVEESYVPENNGRKSKEKKRRKDALHASDIIINGQKVKIAPFDGFMVQSDDAVRLKKLRADMKKRGIPEDQRERALKLERRRAEKALARLRKKVCFHCRSSGHSLSDCPLLQDGSTGICFKCGSSEHTHFQCKVNRRDHFPYAECFICKEQGHIAKQCPDNPRGLYPRGGGCSLCGDVTHLKRNCPKYLAEKEEEIVTVGTRNDRSLEALEEDGGGQPSGKRIKF